MGLAKNSLLYLAATLSIRATSFFLLPLYSNLIPPDIYGQIFVVSSLNNFLSILMSLSMQICISRFYFDCNDEKQIEQLYSTILFFIFISSSLIIAPFYIFSHQLAIFLNIPHYYLLMGLTMSYLGVFYQVVLALLYVMQKAKQVSVTSMCLGICQIVIQLCMVINMNDKATALLSTMMIQAISTFVIFIIYSWPYLSFSFSFKETGKYLKYSFSQFPSDVSGWLVNFTDRIFINKFIGHVGVGIYGIGSNIGQIPMMVFSSMNSAFTPYVNSQYKAIQVAETVQRQDELKANLSRVFLIVSSILIIINTVFIIFSHDIVNLLNQAYSDAFFVVVVMLITSLMNSYRIIYMAPLVYNIKYTKVKSLIWVIAGLLNITLNYFLIPQYGIYSACINSLLTYTITFLLMLYFGNKAFYIKYEWRSLFKVAFISIAFGLTLLLPTSILFIGMKLLLLIPYMYICLTVILNINVLKWIEEIIKKK